MRLNFISLFSGAGGLDIGLEMAGLESSFATDIDEICCETLNKNQLLSTLEGKDLSEFIDEISRQRCYAQLSDNEKRLFFKRLRNDKKQRFLNTTKIHCGDIREINNNGLSKALPPHPFAVVGGPPCQPFSKSGKRKTLDCRKNGDLFYEFVKLVNNLRPKWFIFENVKGLTFTKTDVVYYHCPHCGLEAPVPFRLRQDWASSSSKLVECTNCRKIVDNFSSKNKPGGSLEIILNEFKSIGYRCHSKILNAADFGAPQIRERLFIVGSIDRKDFKWPTPSHYQSDGSQTPMINLAYEKKPWATMYDALWRKGHWHYGKVKKERAVLWVKNVVRPHDEPVTWSLDRPTPTIGAHQSAKLAFAPMGVPEKQIYRQQWHSIGRRQGDTPPVPVEHKYLSDEELLALQTFPRWWYLHGTRMQRAFQIGNAVPPVLGKAIGKALIQAEKE